MYQFIFPESATLPFAGQPHLIYFATSSSRPFFPPRLLHKHDDRLEIIYIAQGQGTYIIDNFPHPVAEGDLIIINPGQTHDEMALPQTGLTMFCCGVSDMKAANLPDNHLLPNGVMPVLHLHNWAPYIHSIFRCMQDFIAKERENAAEVCVSLLATLIGLIQQLYMPSDLPVLDSSSFEAIQRAKLYIDSHYSDDISMEHIAESLNMSVSYMAHSFKDVIGYSPGQYIIRRHIGEAQTLLSLSDSSITQISSMVGYDNSNYFSTLFSKMVRLTPKQYRQFCIALDEQKSASTALHIAR